MSQRKDRRKSTPAPKFGEQVHYLVQFIDDSVRVIVNYNELKRSDDGTKITAMYADKKFYPCLLLAENEDKEMLMKTQKAMDGTKRNAGTRKKTQEKKKRQEKENKKAAKDKKDDEKDKKKEEKKCIDEEKELKKKEKDEKRKALNERDFNVLSKMSELNKSIVVIDEPQRDARLKEKELEKMVRDLEKRQREQRRKEQEWDRENVEYYSDDDDDLDALCARNIDVAQASNLVEVIQPRVVQQQAALDDTIPYRPTLGMKRPRAVPLQSSPKRKSTCTECQDLLAEVVELRLANRLLTDQLNVSRATDGSTNTEGTPKPGKLPATLAEQHNMLELSPGRRVFLYQSHIAKAMARATPTSTALFLFSCFYRDEELIGQSLNGKNGKPKLDEDIIQSILCFTRKKHPSTAKDSYLNTAMRNKITRVETMERKEKAKSLI